MCIYVRFKLRGKSKRKATSSTATQQPPRSFPHPTCAHSSTREPRSRRIKMKAPFLIGRLLFAGFFINSGVSHLQHRKSMAAYARAKGVPQPELAVTLSAVPLLLGGASLLLGGKPKLGAMALLRVLAGVSPVMHDFWRDEDPDTRMNNMIMFMKNLALAGGAMALMGVEEPWEASFPLGKPSLGTKVRDP